MPGDRFIFSSSWLPIPRIELRTLAGYSTVQMITPLIPSGHNLCCCPQMYTFQNVTNIVRVRHISVTNLTYTFTLILSILIYQTCITSKFHPSKYFVALDFKVTIRKHLKV